MQAEIAVESFSPAECGKPAEHLKCKPSEIISLLDMLRVHADHYVAIGQTLQVLAPSGSTMISVLGPPVPQDHCDWVIENLRRIRTHCDQLELKVSSKFLTHYIDGFTSVLPREMDIRMAVDNFQITFDAELKDRCFVFIPPHKAGAFEQDALFGNQVQQAFPSASRNIKDAGNCFALGLDNACVFHCMCVLEYGLHALANALGLSFTVEQWHIILSQIESEIGKLADLPKSTQKLEDQEFYSRAAQEFRYFKDAWRNHVMHGRKVYTESDSDTVLRHVEEFMRHLSTRLRESA